MLEIIVGAVILLAGVIIGFALASAKAEQTNGAMPTTYNGDVINHYGEWSQGLKYDEDTLFKVRKVLLDKDLSDVDADSIINRLHNAGILFRERAK